LKIDATPIRYVISQSHAVSADCIANLNRFRVCLIFHQLIFSKATHGMTINFVNLTIHLAD